MLPNPCPCTTLQWGVKVVAIVGLVFDLLNIFKITAILGGVDASDNFLLRGLQETSHPILIVSLILNMILLGVDIVLYLGAQKRNATMCWVWLGCTLVNFLYSVINSILKLYGDYGTTYVEILVVGVIGLIHGIAITIYVMFVVYAFIIQLRNRPDPQLNPAYQVSTMAQPQGSACRTMEAGTYYTAAQPNYPMESQPLNQPQPTSAPAL